MSPLVARERLALCAALIAALALPSTASIPALFAADLLLIPFFIAIGAIGPFSRWLRSRSDYSLQALHDLHEREELQQIEEVEVASDADQICCPHCGTHYKRWHTCPGCSRV